MRKKALAKLAKAGIDVSSDGPTYRDRARERRAAFNQPKRPVTETATSKAQDHGEEEKDEPATATQSKGASLLGKMGWNVGEGLGAQGTGIVAPVTTEMYVQGVGLGAQGGKMGDALDEAERNTSGGYGEFLERTKDKAKERFQQLS